MSLPVEARRRAAHALEEELSCPAALPVAAIPIDDSRWNRFVDRLTPRVYDFLGISPRVVDAAAGDDFQTLRALACDAASALRVLDGHLEVAAMFDHPRRIHVERLRAGLYALSTTWLALLQAENVDPDVLGRTLTGVRMAVSDARADPDGSERDPWRTCFGIDGDRLCDMEGRISSPLLLVAFHGRTQVLTDRLKRLFSGLAGPGWGPTDALERVSALIAPADPIEVVRVAVRIRALLRDCSVAYDDHRRAVLAGLFRNVEASYYNSKRIALADQGIKHSTSPDSRAMGVLDLYRRVCEGQVRPWAWALVCLLLGDDGPAPMVAELRTRLTSVHDDLAEAFADVLIPEARNAEAHEDYRWDPETGHLVNDQGDFDPVDLEALAYRGYGLMMGAELGWALAAADNPAARSPLEGEGPLSVLKVRRALPRFATNGLRVTGWHLQASWLSVEVADMPFEAINPCAQALVEVAARVPVDGVEVRLPGSAAPVMSASRPVLDALLPVWLRTIRPGVPMPPAVFLPVLFESRLLVETPDRAADAILWMVLNEAVRAFDEFYDRCDSGGPSTGALATLADDLGLVRDALQVCRLTAPAASALTGDDDALLLQAHVHARTAGRLVAPGRVWALRSLQTCGAEITARWETLPPCAPLPTVEETPLGTSAAQV